MAVNAIALRSGTKLVESPAKAADKKLEESAICTSEKYKVKVEVIKLKDKNEVRKRKVPEKSVSGTRIGNLPFPCAYFMT